VYLIGGDMKFWKITSFHLSLTKNKNFRKEEEEEEKNRVALLLHDEIVIDLKLSFVLNESSGSYYHKALLRKGGNAYVKVNDGLASGKDGRSLTIHMIRIKSAVEGGRERMNGAVMAFWHCSWGPTLTLHFLLVKSLNAHYVQTIHEQA
jgi:hypothetical protein